MYKCSGILLDELEEVKYEIYTSGDGKSYNAFMDDPESYSVAEFDTVDGAITYCAAGGAGEHGHYTVVRVVRTIASAGSKDEYDAIPTCDLDAKVIERVKKEHESEERYKAWQDEYYKKLRELDPAHTMSTMTIQNSTLISAPKSSTSLAPNNNE